MKPLLAIVILISYCGIAYADSWTQKANFGGIKRGASAGFSIGTKGYIGTGINFSSSPAFLKDFWQWDQATNVWTQNANFGGTARSGAIGFSIGTKGYIATGYDANIVTRDLWEYDPSTNTWTQKADFGGVGRDYAVAFTINNKGYLGTGYNSVSTNYNDFWQYNPTTNSWSQMANVPGGPRSSAIGFSVNGKGYIGTGYDSGPKNDFYEYDPVTNSWTQKANVPGGLRSDANSFAIGNKGYVVAGVVGSVNQNDLWEYDPATNIWIQKMNLAGVAREDAVSFSIGVKGYIGTGYDPLFNRLNDYWEYGPDGSPLPVELISFTAIKQDGIVIIKWTTVSEVNNSFFALEKSNANLNFKVIAETKGNGNSQQMHEYSEVDEHPINGINYYRLRQTDFNGSITYSKIVSVLMHGRNAPFIIYPNPFKEIINISSPLSGNCSIKLINSDGKPVFSQDVYASGNDPLFIHVPQIPPGCYIVTLKNKNGSFSQKIARYGSDD